MHTKSAESIDMLFGMMSGLGPTNSVLHEGDDPQRGRSNFGKNMCPTSLTPFIIATSPTKDRFCLNLLICCKVRQNSISYYERAQLAVTTSELLAN